MNKRIDITGVVLTTDRLTLRPWRESDLNDFYEYASVDGVGQMAGWNPHRNVEESRMILGSFIKHKKTFALEYKGKVIGSLGVEKYGSEDKLTEFDGYRGREIGFVLSKDYWGRGFMPEAVKAVMQYLFDELDYDFLICGYYNFNEQSKKVQQKCGFVPYRALKMETRMGTVEEGTLNLAINPKKNIKFNFSHRETLIYEE